MNRRKHYSAYMVSGAERIEKPPGGWKIGLQ
jgi:hypothetical protein